MSSLLSLAGGLMGAFVDSMKPQQSQKEVEPINPDSSIQVCVRIRPILRDEKEDSYAWNWEDKTMYPQVSSQAPYTFDHLFFPESSNDDIFNSVVKNVVLQSMNGFNGSIFTYGQTSSGKTFTMNGSQSQPGIIPLSVFYCFKAIQENFPDREFLFRVSYIEVYNEQVKDLLNTEPAHIKIQHDPKQGTILSGVKEQVVLSPQQVIALLKAGEAQRHVGATDMNDKSSRAHTLFKLIIESKKAGDRDDAPVRVSFLNLVDLAGSENAKMTNSTGERAREAKCINQSLLTLSLIIHRLSEEKAGTVKKQYLPYRDSKLTRLLQTSLSGNAKIAVICTVSPSLKCVDESHNTLKFAARAKKIKTSAIITEVLDDKTLLRAYKIEIQNLKARLAAIEVQPAVFPTSVSRNISREFEPSRSSDDMSVEHDADSDIESEGLILQMISEMERLILKADVPTDSKQKNSLGSKGAATSANSRRRSGEAAATASPSNSSGRGNTLVSTNRRDSLSPTSTTKSTVSVPASSGTRRMSHLKPPSSGPPTSATAAPIIITSQHSLAAEVLLKIDEGSGMAGIAVDLHGGFESESLREKDCDDVTTIQTVTTRESVSAVCSDATSLDDSFDGLTTAETATQRKSSPPRRNSFSKNLSSKRVGSDSVSAGDSDFLTVPTLYVDDCKSSSKVAKNYLKAISSPRISGKSKSPSATNSSSTATWSKSGGGAVSPAPRRQSMLEPRGSTAKKFGFIPSPSLSRSLMKVSKDTERTAGFDGNASVSSNGSIGSVNRRRSTISPNSRSPCKGEPDGANQTGLDDREKKRSEKQSHSMDHSDTAATAALVSMAAAYGKIAKPQEKNSSGNHVLFGVSQMLAILKKHVEKSSAAKKRTSHTSHPLASSISLPNVLSTIDETLKAESPRRSESVCSERQDYGHLSIATITATPPLSMLLDHGDDMKGGGDVIREGRFSDVEELTPLGTQRSSISESNSTEMDMNQSTGNVDDRNFLLEEIEKKDNMLAMLTEGLREVEISQDQWLAENDLLSKELEQALLLNQDLNEEVNELKEFLQIRERQLMLISGVLPGYEEL